MLVLIADFKFLTKWIKLWLVDSERDLIEEYEVFLVPSNFLNCCLCFYQYRSVNSVMYLSSNDNHSLENSFCKELKWMKFNHTRQPFMDIGFG